MLRIQTVVTGVAGSPWYINLHTDGDTAGDAVLATAAVRDFWDATKSLFNTSLVFDVSSDVTVINPSTGEVTGLEAAPTSPVLGAGNATMVPKQTQLLIRLRTEFVRNGRRVQGRVFVPGLFSGAVSGQGGLDGATTTLMSSSFAALLEDLAPATPLVVYSKPAPGVPGTVAPVSSFSIWNQWATLNSRRD